MPEIAPIPELQRRLIYALLQPVAALCRRFRVPLDVVEGLCRLAYYEELRRGQQATQSQIASIFGRSLRTVVGVERRFRSDFLSPQYEVELSRKLEERLAVGEATVAELATELDAPEDEISRLLTGLVATGRAVNEGDRFALSERFQSLVTDDLRARIDGLKHQLDVMTAAVRARFLTREDTRPSVARTLSFVGTPDDVETMIDNLVRTLRLQAIDVEENALKGGNFDRYAVTMALAPVQDPSADTQEKR